MCNNLATTSFARNSVHCTKQVEINRLYQRKSCQRRNLTHLNSSKFPNFDNPFPKSNKEHTENEKTTLLSNRIYINPFWWHYSILIHGWTEGWIICLTFWQPIINKINNLLTAWNCNFLSKGSRLTFINATLSNLPIYYHSLFHLPSSVAEQIERIMKQFLWSGNRNKPAFTS